MLWRESRRRSRRDSSEANLCATWLEALALWSGLKAFRLSWGWKNPPNEQTIQMAFNSSKLVQDDNEMAIREWWCHRLIALLCRVMQVDMLAEVYSANDNQITRWCPGKENGKESPFPSIGSARMLTVVYKIEFTYADTLHKSTYSKVLKAWKGSKWNENRRSFSEILCTLIHPKKCGAKTRISLIPSALVSVLSSNRDLEGLDKSFSRVRISCCLTWKSKPW